MQLGVTIYRSGSQKWRGGPVNWSQWETPWLVTSLWTSLYMIQCTSSYLFLFKQEGYIRLRSCSPAKVIFPIWISLCVRLSVYRFSATLFDTYTVYNSILGEAWWEIWIPKRFDSGLYCGRFFKWRGCQVGWFLIKNLAKSWVWCLVWESWCESFTQTIHQSINHFYLFITTTVLLHVTFVLIIIAIIITLIKDDLKDSSSQVWCEGARIFMNPLGANFNLQRANKAWKLSTRTGTDVGLWGAVDLAYECICFVVGLMMVDDYSGQNLFLTHISYHLLHFF